MTDVIEMIDPVTGEIIDQQPIAEQLLAQGVTDPFQAGFGRDGRSNFRIDCEPIPDLIPTAATPTPSPEPPPAKSASHDRTFRRTSTRSVRHRPSGETS